MIPILVLMYDNLVAPILTVATIAGVVSAFWKLFTERQIKRVEGGIQKEISNLNSRLDKQKESFVHVFKAKFDLEIKVYQEIWAAMFELRSAALSMQPRVDSHPFGETEEQKRERLWKRFVNFRQNYNETLVLYVKYQPFYSQEIHDRINDFMGACNREGTRFENSIPMTTYSSGMIKRLRIWNRIIRKPVN